jgi:hypothetical protein
MAVERKQAEKAGEHERQEKEHVSPKSEKKQKHNHNQKP